MRKAVVREWLSRKVRLEKSLCALSAAALLLLGLVAVYVTWWVVYGVIGFGFSWLSLSQTTVTVATWVVVVLLFVGNARTEREYLEDLKFETGDRVMVTVAVARFTGSPWAMALLGPQTARSFVKVLVTLLYIAPRLLSLAFRMGRRAARLRQLDVDGCSRVLAMLLRRDGRVPFRTIFAKHPDLEPRRIIPQLREIAGIVFLPSDPAGLTVTPSLTDEILQPAEAAAAEVSA